MCRASHEPALEQREKETYHMAKEPLLTLEKEAYVMASHEPAGELVWGEGHVCVRLCVCAYVCMLADTRIDTTDLYPHPYSDPAQA